MIFTVEISHYPLISEYEQSIIEFIQELKSHEGLSLQTNSMSTQVKGESKLVMSALESVIRNQSTKGIMSSTVIKIIPTELPIEISDYTF